MSNTYWNKNSFSTQSMESKFTRNILCSNCSQSFLVRDPLHPRGTRCPLILSCGHSACENCIRSALRAADRVMCGICKRTSVPAQKTADLRLNFPLNIYLLGVFAAQHSRQEPQDSKIAFIPSGSALSRAGQRGLHQQNTTESCSECAERKTDWKCIQCGVPYCEQCFNKVHKAGKALSKHQKSPIESSSLLSSPTIIYCAEHQTQKLEFFCKECEVMVCSHCMICQHQGHSAMTKKQKNEEDMEGLDSAREKAVEVLKRMVHTQKKVGEALCLPTATSSKTKSVEQEVIGHFLHLHGMLQLLEESLMEQLKICKTETASSLESVSKELTSNIQEVQQLVQEAVTAKDLAFIDKVEVSAITEKLLEVQNLPCHLLIDGRDVMDTSVRFIVDESFMDKVENHCELEIQGIQRYTLVKTADLPPDVIVEPIEEDNERNSVVSMSSCTSSLSGPMEKVSPPVENQKENSRRPNIQRHSQNSRTVRGSSNVVTVCHLRDPSSFYVHCVKDITALENLSRQLMKHVDVFNTPPESVMKDGLYMVQYHEDMKWYRARVRAVIPESGETKEEMADILYIDYGNTQIVPTTKLRCIPPKFAHTPAIALHCSMFGVRPVNDRWSQEAVKTMAKMVNGTHVKMIVMEISGDSYEVDLCQLPGDDQNNDVPLSVRDALVFLEHACFLNDGQSRMPVQKAAKFFQEESFRKGAVVDVVVSHVETPHSFYVQRLGDHARYLTSIMKDMNTEFINTRNRGIIYTPYVGMACAALYSIDKRWYRAKVISLPGNKMVEVFYVDYGNQEIMIWDQIRKLHPRFLRIAAQAIHCSLTDIIPNQEVWTPAVKDFLVKTTAKKVLRLYVDEVQRNQLKVTLYESQAEVDLCINALLVREGFATSVGVSSSLVEYHKLDGLPLAPQPLPVQQNSKQILNKVSKRRVNINKTQGTGEIAITEPTGTEESVDPFRLEVKILNCPTPSCIYVALLSQEEQIKSLMCDLQDFYAGKTFQSEMPWEVNSKCCAFSVQHKMWYRAIIVELLPDQQAKVFLKDFAELETVPLLNLQPLDSKFLQIRDGAVKCHLSGVRAAGDKTEWPSLACEYLQEQISNYPEIFITKKGEIENWSLPVELWVKHVKEGGPLDPTEEEWLTLNKKLTDQGLAIPLKREYEVQSIPSVQVLKELDEQSAEANKNSVSDWLQLSAQVEGSSKTESSEMVPEVSCDESFSDIEDEAASEPNILSPSISEWLPPVPMIKTKFLATPTYVDDECYVYLHDTEKSADTLTVIGNALHSRFKASQAKPHDLYWFPGQLCIVQYHSDKMWYRGKVVEVNDDRTVKVLFVDYGNVEECKASEMRKNVYMGHIPIQCYKCQLDGIKPASEDGKWTTSTLDFIHTTIVEKQCHVTVKEEPKIGQPLVIDLIGPGNIDIAELLVRMQFAIYTTCTMLPNSDQGTVDDEASVIIEDQEQIEEEDPTDKEIEEEDPTDKEIEEEDSTDKKEENNDTQIFIPSGDVNITMKWSDLIDQEEEQPKADSNYVHYKSLELPNCESFSVEVTAILSATELIIHPCKEENSELFEIKEKFENLTQDIQNEARSQPLIKKPYVGQPCCACYTEDEQWYRAVIIAVDIENSGQPEVKVQYVDYGNVECQPIDKVHMLKPEWLAVPVQGVRCKLWNVERPEEWNPKDLFSKLTECLQPPLIAKIKTRQPVLQVELFKTDGTTLIWQPLIDAGLLVRSEEQA
ncbi:RING finger protein 17 isoform X2 [Periplaneta americana]|uniref:RING finger protein 17 isoform X2 n=1 Tax=Periplaneta americana TaxID=6978 RepID=UPI0037E7FFB7